MLKISILKNYPLEKLRVKNRVKKGGPKKSNKYLNGGKYKSCMLNVHVSYRSYMLLTNLLSNIKANTIGKLMGKSIQ